VARSFPRRSYPIGKYITKGFEIEFRALLADGAQEEVRFKRVVVGLNASGFA
jgi:hypothetical protein